MAPWALLWLSKRKKQRVALQHAAFVYQLVLAVQTDKCHVPMPIVAGQEMHAGSAVIADGALVQGDIVRGEYTLVDEARKTNALEFFGCSDAA